MDNKVILGGLALSLAVLAPSSSQASFPSWGSPIPSTSDINIQDQFSDLVFGEQGAVLAVGKRIGPPNQDDALFFSVDDNATPSLMEATTSYGDDSATGLKVVRLGDGTYGIKSVAGNNLGSQNWFDRRSHAALGSSITGYPQASPGGFANALYNSLGRVGTTMYSAGYDIQMRAATITPSSFFDKIILPTSNPIENASGMAMIHDSSGGNNSFYVVGSLNRVRPGIGAIGELMAVTRVQQSDLEFVPADPEPWMTFPYGFLPDSEFSGGRATDVKIWETTINGNPKKFLVVLGTTTMDTDYEFRPLPRTPKPKLTLLKIPLLSDGSLDVAGTTYRRFFTDSAPERGFHAISLEIGADGTATILSRDYGLPAPNSTVTRSFVMRVRLDTLAPKWVSSPSFSPFVPQSVPADRYSVFTDLIHAPGSGNAIVVGTLKGDFPLPLHPFLEQNDTNLLAIRLGSAKGDLQWMHQSEFRFTDDVFTEGFSPRIAMKSSTGPDPQNEFAISWTGRPYLAPETYPTRGYLVKSTFTGAPAETPAMTTRVSGRFRIESIVKPLVQVPEAAFWPLALGAPGNSWQVPVLVYFENNLGNPLNTVVTFSRDPSSLEEVKFDLDLGTNIDQRFRLYFPFGEGSNRAPLFHKMLPGPGNPPISPGTWLDLGTNRLLTGPDIDNDNEVNNGDYAIWAANNGQLLTGIGGDVDWDDEVTNSDYSIWAFYNGYMGEQPPTAADFPN